MPAVKDVLLNTLGYITVFYFLNELYGVQEYPTLYREIEKRIINPLSYADQNISEMQQLQLDILNLNITDVIENPDTDTDMDEPNELNHKKSKFRRLHSVVIEQ
ncbi:hypothetical protein BDF21DRAFT_467898 [Thamnidium elegans]|nr:hypothetical protein BDF21DRAFT_467898 [Thamnidium elegans]